MKRRQTIERGKEIARQKKRLQMVTAFIVNNNNNDNNINSEFLITIIT